MTIAVIDDDPEMRAYLRALLMPRYEVVMFASGEAALRELPWMSPALILLDFELGTYNGIELLAQLRRHATLAATPVVAVSGHSSSTEQARLLRAGCAAFVAKPIDDRDGLLALISECLAGTHRRPAYDDFDEPTWPERRPQRA
jgi:two-component system cell cycle response regulator DivK